MKLYHAPGSCSDAIRIVLAETGLSAELIQVDPRRHVLEDGADYDAIAELGYVPLLELDDGSRLREGAVIALYLADRTESETLVPIHGTLERYRLLEWMNFMSSEIHKGFIPLLYAAAAGKYIETARPKLLSRFEWIDRKLMNQWFLMGNEFTIADAYLYALTRWGKASWLKSVYNAEIDLSELNNLKIWFERVGMRPSAHALAQDLPV
jgi:glutathione S-transferase